MGIIAVRWHHSATEAEREERRRRSRPQTLNVPITAEFLFIVMNFDNKSLNNLSFYSRILSIYSLESRIQCQLITYSEGFFTNCIASEADAGNVWKTSVVSSEVHILINNAIKIFILAVNLIVNGAIQKKSTHNLKFKKLMKTERNEKKKRGNVCLLHWTKVLSNVNSMLNIL